MKKWKFTFLFFFLTLFFSFTILYIHQQKKITLEDFEKEMSITCVPPPNNLKILYPDCIPYTSAVFYLKELGEKYELEFKDEKDYAEREYIENYDIRTIKSPFPHYDKYKPIFYNIPVNAHKIMPDIMDKKHKIAVVFQKYNMYHFDDPKLEEKKGFYMTREFPSGKTLKIFYNVDTEFLKESTVRKENQFFQDLIEQADTSMKVKKPFQNEDTYTVIYIERGFCQWLYYNEEVFQKEGRYEGALTPYLEKAFESLGYTKKE